MRYYLDTSTIIKLSSRLHNFANDAVFTSSFSIFELISGISKSDYRRRKRVIENVLKSGLTIDFDSFDMKKYRCIGVKNEDVDGFLIKEMAKLVVNCDSIHALEQERIHIKGKIFSIHDFKTFDNNLSNETRNLFYVAAEELAKMPKNEKIDCKKTIKNELYALYKILFEIWLSQLVEFVSNAKRPSEEYYNHVEKYDNSLDTFYYCLVAMYFLSQTDGRVFGKNDFQDILHTCFISPEDIIISDDKIFKTIETKCYGPKNYQLTKFVEEYSSHIKQCPH